MKKIDFEDWLMEKYVEEERPLKDMIPDGFNDWVCQLDPQEFIDYGQKYAESILSEYQGEAVGFIAIRANYPPRAILFSDYNFKSNRGYKSKEALIKYYETLKAKIKPLYLSAPIKKENENGR